MPSPSKKSDNQASALIDLAKQINSLRYGDLMVMAGLLVVMVEDSPDYYDLELTTGMAELLHDWAVGQIEASEEEE